MTPLHRSVAVALLAPLLAFAVSASGFVGLRCRITGMISIATCCPDSSRDDSPPAQSSVDDPGCCERVVVDNAKPTGAGTAATQGTVAPAAPIAFVLAGGAGGGPQSSHSRLRPAADAPYPFRSPLHLLHRALLI
jgi:hypothetical protein